MLKDKIVLITGASRGIGRATALLAAKNHASVIINYKNSEKEATDLMDLIIKDGGGATKIRADVSVENEVREMFDRIRTQYKRLDVLVNNAGSMKSNLLTMTAVNEFDSLVATNDKGVFLCAQYAAKMMIREGEGRIINVSSIIGRYGAAGMALYSASKAFVIGLTKSLAKELGAYGIAVNAVAPGLIDTDLVKDLKEEVKRKIISNIALGRMGKPEDVAKVILFLASDLADYVSGQILGVDGCETV